MWSTRTVTPALPPSSRVEAVSMPSCVSAWPMRASTPEPHKAKNVAVAGHSLLVGISCCQCAAASKQQSVTPPGVVLWYHWECSHTQTCSQTVYLRAYLCVRPLQVALTSPYPVPQVPLERVINNTIAHLNDGHLPTSAKQWVQMAGSAGGFVAKSMPFFMARAMQVGMSATLTSSATMHQPLQVLRGCWSGVTSSQVTATLAALAACKTTHCRAPRKRAT